MQYPLNLVLENWVVIVDGDLKLPKLLIHILVMLQKWLEIH